MSNCTVCERKHYAKGFCKSHYMRAFRGSNAHTELLGPNGYTYGARSYTSAHRRCETMWGKANEYRCVRCAARAAEWAYDHTDPSEMSGRGGRPYSSWPEFYMPMCLPCHRSLDAQ